MVTSSKYFNEMDLRCKCGCQMCEMDPLFLKELDNLYRDFGSHIYISSAFRCKEHNKAVGGHAQSAHLIGKAADLLTTHLDLKDRYHLLYTIMVTGFPHVGIGKTFIHIDTKGPDNKIGPLPVDNRLWVY